MIDEITFFEKYESKFYEAVETVNHLVSYDGFCKWFLAFGKLTLLEWYHFQKDWMRLNCKFTNPLEIGFFQPSWVPVSVNEYECFIDMEGSTNNIFAIGFFNDNVGWYIHPVIENCSDLFHSLDNIREPSADEAIDLMESKLKTPLEKFYDDLFWQIEGFSASEMLRAMRESEM